MSIAFLALSHVLLLPANCQARPRLWWGTILQFALIILLALDVAWKLHNNEEQSSWRGHNVEEFHDRRRLLWCWGYALDTTEEPAKNLYSYEVIPWLSFHFEIALGVVYLINIL